VDPERPARLRGGGHGADLDLDRWLPKPLVRTNHRRESTAGARKLWATAATIRLRDCRVLGPLIRARIPGLRPGETFDELFSEHPFYLLEEGPRHRLSGLCGRIWTVRGDFARLDDPADFLTWHEPRTVRVLFANWAERSGEGAAIVSEVRIAAVDRRATLYVRELQPFIAAFEGLVGTEPLSATVRRADGLTGGR
jgi:hypothetical protein